MMTHVPRKVGTRLSRPGRPKFAFVRKWKFPEHALRGAWTPDRFRTVQPRHNPTLPPLFRWRTSDYASLQSAQRAEPDFAVGQDWHLNHRGAERCLMHLAVS